jgi:hypothetical protein
MQYFRNGGDPKAAGELLAGMPVLNMLNTKYVIYNPGQPPLLNSYNYGDAWFVNDIKTVVTAREELDSLSKVNLIHTAILRQDRVDDWGSYQNYQKGGRIELTSYAPDKLIYQIQSPGQKIAVFSDIYYPRGWNAYVDEEKAEIKRVDYILRAIMVPGGSHKVEFRFEPKSVNTANALAMIGGVLIVLFGIALIWTYRGKLWEKNRLV